MAATDRVHKIMNIYRHEFEGDQQTMFWHALLDMIEVCETETGIDFDSLLAEVQEHRSIENIA